MKTKPPPKPKHPFPWLTPSEAVEIYGHLTPRRSSVHVPRLAKASPVITERRWGPMQRRIQDHTRGLVRLLQQAQLTLDDAMAITFLPTAVAARKRSKRKAAPR